MPSRLLFSITFIYSIWNPFSAAPFCAIIGGKRRKGGRAITILIQKSLRRLTLLSDAGAVLHACGIALGGCPTGRKEREGDGRTPEGEYYVCLKKIGKYGPSLGISYPSARDALLAGADEKLIALIREREINKERPPWGSGLGGEIYIHGGGTGRDWTAGCVALNDGDARILYELAPQGARVVIEP